MEAPPAAPRTRAVDRLSALPDCLLSRRWRHLWRALPCVDIDQREFWPPEPAALPAAAAAAGRIGYWLARDERQRGEAPLWNKFEDAADMVSLPHGASSPQQLDTFRLRVAYEYFYRAHRWIRRGLERAPAELHLCCDNDPFCAGEDEGWPYFPDDAVMEVSAGPFTFRLRTLHLSGLSLSCGFPDALAVEFPLLEHLRLEDCKYEFRRLASRSLRSLSMDHCRRHERDVDVLVLAAPHIASLRIRGDPPPPPVGAEGEMPSLVAASLAHPAGDLGVLWSLRDATSLELSGFSATALLDEEPDDGLPVFRNLRTLRLHACDLGVECQALRRFLRNAPNLETIALHYCAIAGGSRSRDGPEAYQCRNLKSIELKCYEHDAVACELAEALHDISKELVHPIESSVREGKRRVKFWYTGR